MKITIVADISSRIAQERRNADRITAAAVCLPTGALSHIRKRIPSDLPKWRDASDTAVELVSDIVLREALGIAVYSLDKTGDKWDQFWADAESKYSELRGKVSVVKAAYQIKCLMYVKSIALSFAGAAAGKNLVLSSNPKHRISTNETLILDKEIDGDYNVEVFQNIWNLLNAGSQLSEELGIRRNFDELRFATEQEDRLLMLPDYVAGIAHAAFSQANVLAASRVSAECVHNIQKRFGKSPHYLLEREEFSLTLSEIIGDL